MSEIPGPKPTPETAAYWAAAAEGRFLVPRCNACGKTHWYPRAICPFCASMDVSPIEGPTTGTVYSVTTLAGKTPLTAAYVTLDGGPTMLAPITGQRPVGIGDAVSLVFLETRDGPPVPAFTALG